MEETDGMIATIDMRDAGLKALEKLIKENGNVNEKNADGQPPLSQAVFLDSFLSIRKLVEMGADVNATDQNGVTALNLAAMKNSLDAAKILLSVPGINLEANRGGKSSRLYSLTTSQCPPLSGPTRRMSPASLSCFSCHFIPSEDMPHSLASSSLVISG